MDTQPIETPVKVDVASQAAIKKCSDKQREALRLGREKHHANARAYKEMLNKQKEEAATPPPPPPQEPPKVQRQIAFL
jgi:hypothetical protein